MELKRIALCMSNATMMAMWARVLIVYTTTGWNALSEDNSAVCNERLRPLLLQALAVSYLELVTSLIGLTRSNPLQVVLFATVRAGVEVLVTPLIGCSTWQHLFTALCWSLGDAIRFGCFAVDCISPQRVVKSIRYTVGPFLFPLGAGGEMLMVLQAATDGRPSLYLAAALWPAGFYPLMKQLLKQRRKHFTSKID
jgi:Protein tyrosine phosphatase-like protein, PTPLA